MSEHRFEAHATITPGEHELTIGGARLQLVCVALSDGGPLWRDDGTSYQRADVVCPLRPAEARALAARLLELADHADHLSRR
jgi:hypothetical protein